MKNLSLIIFMFAGTVTGGLLAQSGGSIQKEKMKAFARWEGNWQGEGVMQQGPGEARKSAVTERVELKLDGTILLVEGIGTHRDPASNKESIVHHALAVLSYDQESGEYKFRTYLKDGRSTDAWLKVLEENRYQWGFDTSQGKVRYNVRIDPANNTWSETGEYSQDGRKWSKFFEMNLAKVD